MKTELNLFGKHFNMASQTRRRVLVLLVYAGFAALMLAGWLIDRWHVWGSTAIIFIASYASRLVLGGYGAEGKGMVKPFLGNEVRARYIKNPDSLWSRLCRLTIPRVTDEREFCSDEREVHRRDRAHEVAYRYLGMEVTLTFLVAYFRNTAPPLLPQWTTTLSAALFDQLIYGLLIAAFILFQSLPQAILLWTEPDMETEA